MGNIDRKVLELINTICRCKEPQKGPFS
ncbi:uncharacterized protein METZ01_LOCUS515820 [marine metagenome]|uniref:Uncharacterized protein n=1 Tax=marine metagenome TaxID=408172 RepID=A0A383F1F5_9ZZZZ